MSATIVDASVELKVLDALVSMPRIGAWHADVEAAGEATLSGSVTLKSDDQTFVGTVVPGRSGTNGGRSRAKVVGGAGGLPTTLPAKNYKSGPKVRAIVADILREAGETLSATADDLVLDVVITAWERRQGPASRCLNEIVGHVDAVWRILDDGTVWVGVDTYPEVEPEHRLLDEDWALGEFEIAPDQVELRPGVTFLGQQIALVRHRIRQSAIRTEVSIVGSPGTVFERIFKPLRQAIDYSRLWPARVVSQRANGKLELDPDDARFKGLGGLDQVPIRPGIPGTTVTVPKNTRVRLGFDGGDPTRPFAALWDVGAVTLVVIGDTGNADSVALNSKVEAQLQRLKSAITTAATGASDGGAAFKANILSSLNSPPAETDWPESMAAEKLKTE